MSVRELVTSDLPGMLDIVSTSQHPGQFMWHKIKLCVLPMLGTSSKEELM